VSSPGERVTQTWSGPPPRPHDRSPEALGFQPQPPVRWFNPGVLTLAALRVTLSAAFGSFLDKRELQARLDSDVDRQHADRPEVWLDYVADTGDGFDATYSVASLLARQQLEVAGLDAPLPRGRLLVLGGDQTYPVATTDDYTNRLAGPFEAALPWTVDDHPTIYALPGNHDWYDGLTGFLRQFAQHRWIGGWRTRQNRSYFAIQLPHRWWLWGMDIQSDHYVDEPQLEYFSQAMEHSRPGDRLVLATATPSWIDSQHRPRMYRNLAFVQHNLLLPHEVELKLVLAGNLHHYNRYSRDAADGALHQITSGGGGAFLYPTHDLPSQLHVPADPTSDEDADDANDADQPRTYDLVARYPDASRSRWLALAAVMLPFRNPGMAWLMGMAHVVLLWTNQFGIRSLDPTPQNTTETFMATAEGSGWEDLTLGLLRNSFSALILLALAVGLVALAQSPSWARRRWSRYLSRLVLGLLHTAAHTITVVGVSLLAIRLASPFDGANFVAATNVYDAVLGGLAGSMVLGAYFALATTLPGLHVHGNEAFAAARLTRYKNFLRMHVGRDGRLTVYAVGIDRVAHHWRIGASDASDPEQPWLVPERRPLAAHLVDRVTVE
jgi:hypothetical protein